MKSKQTCICILMAVCFSCALLIFGCAEQSFEGFSVRESAVGEAGEEYVFETPEVHVNGEAAEITVLVRYGETQIPHDGKKVYLENVGEYVVEYTATAAGKEQKKTTALTVKDSVGPVIVSELSPAIKYNTTVKLADYFKAKDISEAEFVAFSVKDITTEQELDLQDGQFDSENSSFRITDENVKELCVYVRAKDAFDHESSRTVKVKMIPATDYGYYAFSAYENGETEIDGVTVDFGKNSENTSLSVVQDGERKAVKVELTTVAINNLVKIRLDESVVGEFGNFDSISVEMKLEKESIDGKPAANGGNAGLGGEFYYALGDTGNAFNYSGGEWKTFTFTREESFAAIKKTASLEFYLKPWAEQKVAVYIGEIRGAYNSVVVGETVDLVQKTGLAETEFTAEFVSLSGIKTAVEDTKAFLPQAEGKLIITVHKDGYRVSTAEIKVIEKAAPGTLLNLSEYELGESYPISGGEAGVIFDEVSGKRALKITNTGKNGSGVILKISGDAVKELVNYDYFVIKARVYYEGVSANVNLQVSNVSGRPSWGDFPASNGGDGTAHEWVFDKTVNSWTFTPETESFTIKIVKWNDAPQVTIVTDIYAYNEAA